MCLAAALSYAFAGIYGRRFHAMGVPPLATATGQVVASSLILLPLVLIVDRPWTLPPPSLATLAALVGVAAISTALAYVLYFRILATAGATNLLLVTFLIPVSAILLGTLFLGEVLLPRHLAGMALIGAGLAAIDGRPWRAVRRAAAMPGRRRNNLGNALWTLGRTRERHRRGCEEAVDAYRDALEERTRERVPLDWAMTQNNLGTALSDARANARAAPTRLRRGRRRLPRRAQGMDPRARAARLGDDAEQPRQRALDARGTRERHRAAASEAVDAYRDALEEWTRERVPLDWATTQNNLGTALSDARGTRERHRRG